MSKKGKEQFRRLSRREFCENVSLAVGGIALTSSPLRGYGQQAIVAANRSAPFQISGRYPHLALFNHNQECGIGAVVAWADRLWAVTYGPHSPYGSEDGLYEITPEFELTKRKESIGGTPANRMIHRESNQLFIGPYAIDEHRRVRPIPYDRMPGRHTANARHLTQPESKVYYMTMEEGLYEVDVNTLEVRTLFKDDQLIEWLPEGGFKRVTGRALWNRGVRLPGVHGKGGYSGQNRVLYANNGRTGAPSDLTAPSGCLATWDGKSEHWEVVESHQFMDITGPGGIYGNESQDAPVWAAGWDYRSVVLKLLDDDEWHTFRLPKGSYHNDSLSGTLTEWFRIRQVGPKGQYLMDHHGQWFEFPGDFSKAVHRAPTPIATHLKITPDFERWQDQLVFGCNDTPHATDRSEGKVSAFSEQANSNLWFTRWDDLKNNGRPHGFGGPWVLDRVAADVPSEPYAFRGFRNRQLHLSHRSNHSISFRLEIDRSGKGGWEALTKLDVPAFGYAWHPFPDDLQADWVRLVPDRGGEMVNAYFHYGTGGGAVDEPERFEALPSADLKVPRSGGLLRARAEDPGTLEFAAWTISERDKASEAGYYEIDIDMKLRRINNRRAHKQLKSEVKIDRSVIEVDEASVIVKDEKDRPYRLPKGSGAFDQSAGLDERVWRTAFYYGKVLFNSHGTLYVLAPNHGGVAHIQPVATHNKRITDFSSWRGTLVLAGCRNDLDDGGEHFIKSDDGKVGLWFGDVDDLWKLGKPRGVGGPWKNSAVAADTPSDPYLMTGYDRKSLALSHNASEPVTFGIEVQFTMTLDPQSYSAYGEWYELKKITVQPGETKQFQFPDGFSAHWVRLKSRQSCRASAIFTYT